MSKRNKYEREALYQEIWAEPVSTVSKRYGVSDVALRKVCKALDIPMPPRGYWARVAAGQKIERPALSVEYTGPHTKDGKRSDVPSCGNRKVDKLDFLDDDSKLHLVAAIALIKRIKIEEIELSPKISEHLLKIEKWDITRQWGAAPFLSKSIAAESRIRALRIIQAVDNALEKIGGKVDDELKIHLAGEHIRYNITEHTNRSINEQHAVEKPVAPRCRDELPQQA